MDSNENRIPQGVSASSFRPAFFQPFVFGREST
jgi:hypothetical protein